MVWQLPSAVKEPLSAHLQGVKRQYEEDARKGLGRIALPDALERKYPNAGKEWAGSGYFLHPATTLTELLAKSGGTISTKRDFRRQSKKPSGKHESRSRRVPPLFVILLRPICWKMGTTFAMSRNSSATADVSTTMVYTHVWNRGGRGVNSLADRL